MKKILLLVILLIGELSVAQNNFEKGMKKAFELWEADQWDQAENMFERIAQAEPEQWLPNYYIAQMNSLKSWDEKDEAVLRAQLGKAQEHINTAMALSPENPELMVLQAHIYTNWIAYDGMTYGMKYSTKVAELYNKAMTLAPDNPRVAFSKADWDMGSARYFGQDPAPYCKDIEKSLVLFTNFKAESDFHPNWGKKRAEQVLAECKE